MCCTSYCDDQQNKKGDYNYTPIVLTWTSGQWLPCRPSRIETGLTTALTGPAAISVDVAPTTRSPASYPGTSCQDMATCINRQRGLGKTHTHTHTHTHPRARARRHARTHAHTHTHTHARARARAPVTTKHPNHGITYDRNKHSEKSSLSFHLTPLIYSFL